MKKSLLGLVAIPLIITSGLTYADNEHIVYDTANGTITVYTGDFSYGITIQDKNLGASVAGTGPTSYGYYFQRGNNHGNPEGSETVMQLIDWDDSYENHGYDGEVTKFINIHNGNNLLNQNYDYWVETSIGNGDTIYANWTGNNLWGGGNDNDDSDPKIVKGYDTEKHQATNLAGRQGPCESGYHVPSAGERNELVMLWCNVNPDTCDSSAIKTMYNGGTYLMKDGIGTTFSNDLKLPLAGYRIIDLDLSTNNYFDSVQLKEQDGFFMSSSVSDDFLEHAFDFYITPEVANPRGALFRVDGDSVRCFKNEYIEFPKFTVTFLDDGEIVASGSVVSGGTWNETIPTVTKTGYKLDYRHLTGVDEAFDFTSPITGDITLYAKWSMNKDIVIQAIATEADQTIKINKYFANAYTVDWGDGNTGDLTADTGHSYDVASGYTITLSLSGADRWTFLGVTKPLVPTLGTTTTGVKITYMPSLADGFGNNATTPGTYFFRSFNNNGALTSLPDGSFDTSNITTAGAYFFRAFNEEGALTSLPENSFNISNITTAGDNFFANFNFSGALTSLPDQSFNTSNITTIGNNFFWQFNTYGSLESLPENSFNTSNISGSVGNEFFRNFNFYGQLTSLPTGSFNISNISGSVGNRFFYGFNDGGELTSLPEGSFDTSHITTVGDRFFESFNCYGQLTSLPTGSFDISKITTVGNYFFSAFNFSGVLTSLPTGSFRLSTGLTEVGHSFFYNFNGRGQLTSLPTGSFDTSHITTAGNDFFRQVNPYGQLTSLPENSFNISNLTTVGNNAFRYFNGNGGTLESLPEGSFDTSNIVSAGTGFSYYFNGNGGKITNLPNSFTLNSIGASKDYGYQNAFDSTGYTLNKKVSDLVEGITEPSTDMNTFSDNQPGRCGVHENWLVNPETACNVLYDSNGGEGTITGGYNTYTTGVTAGSGIVEPTRTGYILSGWIDASGNRLDEVVFPDMDGETLYANWMPNEYPIVFVDGSGDNESVIYSGKYNLAVEVHYPNWTKEGYTIHWDKEIPVTMPLSGETITASWTKKNKPSGGSSGGGGGGGGGSSSSKTDTGNASSQTGNQINSNTGDTTLTGTNIKEPETNTGSSIQTGSQVDSNTGSIVSSGTNVNNPDTDTPGGSTAPSQNDKTYSTEFQEAYEFAKGNGITTMPTIQKANMEGKLTRIAMAKMLSQYAMNVLGKTPDTTQNNKFNDVTDKLDSDYDNGVTLAYQLGIMGQNMPGNNFRPDDEVTRAEFATALSRMLYNTSDGQYKSTDKYYTNHMSKLVKEGIITKDDPKMKELRGYVMIMLMRSAK